MVDRNNLFGVAFAATYKRPFLYEGQPYKERVKPIQSSHLPSNAKKVTRFIVLLLLELFANCILN